MCRNTYAFGYSMALNLRNSYYYKQKNNVLTSNSIAFIIVAVVLRVRAIICTVPDELVFCPVEAFGDAALLEALLH